MKSIEYSADRFEDLRCAYFARLADDRVQIGNLRRKFARPELRGRPLYDEIRRVAHNMAGAAAVFEAPQVVCAAAALEDAVLAAYLAPSPMTDADLGAAIRSLDQLLESLAP